MGRPRNKQSIVPNQEYLKQWDEYQRKSTSNIPILLPISVSIEDGIIERSRIKSTDIAAIREDLLKEFKNHCQNPNGYLENKYSDTHFQTMLDDYIDFFVSDSNQGHLPPGPLDIIINRPVWLLFYLPRKNWRFSKDRQFSVENDRDDFGRNFEKITTFKNNNFLLLANHCRSSPKGLKYNLHVTITQKENGKILKTPIIIDPGSNNGTRGGGGDGGGSGQQSLP